jgi:hypothetical protein
MTKSDSDIKKITSVTLNEINSHFSNTSTYSTLFLIPAFDIELNSKVFEMFENAFVDHQDFMHLYERPLFCLFKVGEKEISKFQEITPLLISNPNFVYTYCAGRTNNFYLFMYVFECPEPYKIDYDKFLEGKYSEFSLALKSKFNNKVMLTNGVQDESPIYGALFKTSDMRRKMEAIVGQRIDVNGEFWPAPKDEFEIFNYTKNDTN